MSIARVLLLVSALVVVACGRDGDAESSASGAGETHDESSSGGAATGAGGTGGTTSGGLGTSSSTSGDSTSSGAADTSEGSSGAAPTCGDGSCGGDETCTTCQEDCGYCPPGACSSPGGHACGGEAIGGDPGALYVCEGGTWTLDHPCEGPCEAMPAGVPDRCASDLSVPAGLIDAVDAKPYVEGSCAPGEYPGWPYKAQECTYNALGLEASVTVANPSPARVGAWIVDASTFIPTLWALKASAPDAYEKGVVAIGGAMMGQSSRIFPLHGGIIEDLGGGAVIYPFDKGVTEGCSSGCYCRINSLHRTEWCGFQEFLGVATYDDCIAEVGASGLTPAWGQRCLQNHIDAWKVGRNEHFRAKAWTINASVKQACPSYDACTPTEVVAAVKAALG